MPERIVSRRSIEDFKSHLSNGGVRPTMFEVNILLPQYLRNLYIQNPLASTKSVENFDNSFSMLCKSATIPESNVTTISTGLPGGAALKLPGSRIVEPWTCTIINDGQFSIRSVLEDWSSLIKGNAAPRSTMDFGNYMSTVQVFQLDRQGRELRRYQLEYCWPMLIEPIQLDYGSNDAIEEFAVTWQYHYFNAQDRLIYDGETRI